MSHAMNASKDHNLLMIDDCDAAARRADLWVPAAAEVAKDGTIPGITVLPGATFEQVLGPDAGSKISLALQSIDWDDLARPPCALEVCFGPEAEKGMEGLAPL